MKKFNFISICLIFCLTIMLSACMEQIWQQTGTQNTLKDTIEDTINSNDQIYCIADVMECPDGSFVAREPEKNCEFKECPVKI